MKKEVTEMAKKTMFKKTGWKLLLMLAVFIWSAIMPTLSSAAEWTIEQVDAPKTFTPPYDALAIDSSNQPHIAYGGDHLYHAYFDGTKWQDEVVDKAPLAGMNSSIAIDSNDKLHISYYAIDLPDQTTLKYATNASGSWVTETLATTVEKYEIGHISIAIDSNDKVHISYYEGSPKFILKYATNTSGVWMTETLATQSFLGSHSSIAIDSNNNVHISYMMDEITGYEYYCNIDDFCYEDPIVNNNVKYVTNASGAWVIETVDTIVDSFFSERGHTSIAVDSNNNVHISYWDWTNYGLKYATNSSGAWVFEFLDADEYVGFNSSIAIDSDNNVHISYFVAGNTNRTLKYVTNASGAWLAETVDTEGADVGGYTSIAIDSNDNVHISYSFGYYANYLSTNYVIKYITNASGAWVPETVETEGGNVGRYTSIAVDSNDNLHISYHDSTNSILKYATNASGDWVVETVDTEGVVSGSTSIAIDSNDNVHISYYDNLFNSSLKYATNASGDWVIETLYAVGWSFGCTSISIDSNDNVHISYYDEDYGALKYATNASGLWVTEAVDTQGLAGKHNSIAIDSNDKVHISYHGRIGFKGYLKYATNASGDWVIEGIDAEGGNEERHISIAIASNDTVHISYDDATNGEIKYAKKIFSTWQIETVDTGWIRGAYSSIAVDSTNKAHISYSDSTTGDLKYATNASKRGWVIKNVDTEGWVGAYNSIAIDSNDNVHISYFDGSNADLKHATHAPDVQSASAEDAYDVLTTDPTAVMFDTRTVDEHNGYCPPWWNCGGQIAFDTTYAGTPQWTVGGVEKLPITLPYWDAGTIRDTGAPEDEAQVRNIIEGALAANIIDFDTSIYFIDRTAYRSYYMVTWMNTQTFTNPATGETASFAHLLNIDFTPYGVKSKGGMEEWNAAGLPIFDGTIVPPQILSGYPEDGYIETSTNDVIFAAGILEPTTAGFVYPDVTEVLLYIGGSSPVSMTQVDEAVLRAFFAIPDDVVLPGKVYMATKYLPDGIYAWNVKATNSAGASWNLHVLNESAQGPGQRTLTVDTCSPSGDDTDCNGKDDDCDGIPDDGYIPTGTTCGIGICAATGQLTCSNGIEVDSCVENEPTGDDFDCDGLDNNCDGVADNNYLPTDTTCGLGICTATGQTECIDGAEIDTCAPGTPPETPEATCNDILDNDCDGLTDTDDSDCPLTHTITATAGSGGSISPSDDVMVDAGSDQTFTITPRRGYQVSDVLVDAVSVGQVRSYTFTNVSSDHTIRTEFTKRGMRRGMRRGGRGRR